MIPPSGDEKKPSGGWGGGGVGGWRGGGWGGGAFCSKGLKKSKQTEGKKSKNLFMSVGFPPLKS